MYCFAYREVNMTLKHVVEKIAATRNSSVKELFREAYNRYYSGEIPEDELVKDCKAFHDHNIGMIVISCLSCSNQ